MGMSLPVDFLPKILITGDQNPVFVKRFFVKLGRHLIPRASSYTGKDFMP